MAGRVYAVIVLLLWHISVSVCAEESSVPEQVERLGIVSSHSEAVQRFFPYSIESVTVMNAETTSFQHEGLYRITGIDERIWFIKIYDLEKIKAWGAGLGERDLFYHFELKQKPVEMLFQARATLILPERVATYNYNNTLYIAEMYPYVEAKNIHTFLNDYTGQGEQPHSATPEARHEAAIMVKRAFRAMGRTTAAFLLGTVTPFMDSASLHQRRACLPLSDRHPGNYLYDPDSDQIWLVDTALYNERHQGPESTIGQHLMSMFDFWLDGPHIDSKAWPAEYLDTLFTAFSEGFKEAVPVAGIESAVDEMLQKSLADSLAKVCQKTPARPVCRYLSPSP